MYNSNPKPYSKPFFKNLHFLKSRGDGFSSFPPTVSGSFRFGTPATAAAFATDLSVELRAIFFGDGFAAAPTNIWQPARTASSSSRRTT